MNRQRFLAIFTTFIATVFFVVHPYMESSALDKSQLLTALQEGEHVIYFRHAEKGAAPDNTSRLPDEFDACLFPDTLLTEAGVASMRSIGQKFQQLDIPVGQVVSSPVCRCIESAWFGFEKATIDISLNGVYEKDSAGEYIINEAVTEPFAVNLRRLLVKVPDEGTNTLLFAHSSNILALTGLKVKEGEAVIFKPDGQGHFVYVGQMLLDDWDSLGS